MILCLNTEMIDHCILYIPFNKQTIWEWMIFLFAEITTIDSEYVVLIYALTISTPNLFFWIIIDDDGWV